MIYFGPSSADDMFYEMKYKNSEDMPKFLSEMGLNAFEYSCTKGVRISDEKALRIKESALVYDIFLSVHSPYYINLATNDEENREKSVNYILDTMRIAKVMGAKRVVVHAGACAKIERIVALEYAKKTLKITLERAKQLDLDMIHICPETMGKVNQLGDLDEVMELCKIDDSLIPTIDFGHLNARTMGGIVTKEDYAKILDSIKDKLGTDRYNCFHSHFSKIEYTKGGEKRHLTFADEDFGPDPLPLMQLVRERGISPVFICESSGTQARDAKTMKEMYCNENFNY